MDSKTRPAYTNSHRGRFELQVLLHDVIEKINQEPTVGLDAEQVDRFVAPRCVVDLK